MKHFNILLLLIPAMLTAQEICGSQIIGAKTETEAEQKAAASLAQAINSKVSYENKTEEIIDGTESKQRDTTKASINSKLLNAHAAKYAKGKNAEGYFSKACMSAKDAAAPYMNSLKDLARTLKTQLQKAKDKNDCKSIDEIYKKIGGEESVLNNLAQLSGEVQAEYESLKKQYKSDGKGGIFLDIKENIFGEKSNVIESKLKEVLSANNCRPENNICANGSFTLKIDATACNHKNDGSFDHCSACLKVDLLNGKNEIVLSPSVAAKAAWDGKAAACEKAFEQAAPEIFTKIKNQISEVCK